MKTLKEVKAQYLEGARSNRLGDYVVRDPKTGAIIASSAEPWDQPMLDGSIIAAQKLEENLFKSADGEYYADKDLPEHDDAFCTALYAEEMRIERNRRIELTDDYIRLPDATVMREEGAKREALSDAERKSVLVYREALRNMPEQKGFPFIDFPEAPDAIAYESEQAINQNQGGYSYEH